MGAPRQARGAAVLIDPAMLGNKLLRGGLTAFFFQYLLQAGLFFVVPLFLSVALGLSAIDTGLRILPLSIALLVAAVGIPKLFPHIHPAGWCGWASWPLFAGVAALAAALDIGVGPEVVTWPMLLAGLGIGALASQLGSVTVSAVPDEQSAEVGGLQNTVTFLGSSIGTALVGAVLISALSSSFFAGIQGNQAIPADLSSQAQVQLAAGVPFVADGQLSEALADVGVPGDTAAAIVAENSAARLDGLRSALIMLALLALLALFFCGGVPDRQPSDRAP